MSAREEKLAPPGPAWKAAEEIGMDMSLVEANLHRSMAERIRAHDRTLNTALALRQAVQRQTENHGGT